MSSLIRSGPGSLPVPEGSAAVRKYRGNFTGSRKYEYSGKGKSRESVKFTSKAQINMQLNGGGIFES
jgi:hypothetical protein